MIFSRPITSTLPRSVFVSINPDRPDQDGWLEIVVVLVKGISTGIELAQSAHETKVKSIRLTRNELREVLLGLQSIDNEWDEHKKDKL